MNRRKAILYIFAGAVGGSGLFAGYEWLRWHRQPDVAWLEQHRDTLAALTETIIPSGDSPGAREAGVPDFIITMIRDCTDNISSNKFIDGLKELDSYCRSEFGQPYQACTAGQQESTLRHFEQKGKPFNGRLGKAQEKYLGKSFFSTLKAYTVYGYCTSQQGATKGLAYVLIPGSYQGCIPKLPGQKAWATK